MAYRKYLLKYPTEFANVGDNFKEDHVGDLRFTTYAKDPFDVACDLFKFLTESYKQNLIHRVHCEDIIFAGDEEISEIDAASQLAGSQVDLIGYVTRWACSTVMVELVVIDGETEELIDEALWLRNRLLIGDGIKRASSQIEQIDRAIDKVFKAYGKDDQSSAIDHLNKVVVDATPSTVAGNLCQEVPVPGSK